MTIIGFERLRAGGKNLIVFVPMFRDASNILKLVGRKFEYNFPDLALKPYRRGDKYLRKYREFEVLRCVLLPTTLGITRNIPCFCSLLTSRP